MIVLSSKNRFIPTDEQQRMIEKAPQGKYRSFYEGLRTRGELRTHLFRSPGLTMRKLPEV
jgi:hypothetical protein